MTTTRKIVVVSLLLLLPLALASAQQDCFLDGGTKDVISDQSNGAGHINGTHVFAGVASEQCLYYSNSTPYCDSQSLVTMYVGYSDSGVLTTVVGHHVGRGSTNDGSQYGSNGASASSGNSVVSFEWCLSSSCFFTVSASPLSFPSTAVWTFQQTGGSSCSALLDPTYIDNGGDGGGGLCNCGDPGCYCGDFRQAPKSGTSAPSAMSRKAAQVERNIVAADHRLN